MVAGSRLSIDRIRNVPPASACDASAINQFADKFFSANWFMAEASHALAGGTFRIRSMLSLDPATITNGRYPELLQTGETSHVMTIIDGQHPHDLFMEL